MTNPRKRLAREHLRSLTNNTLAMLLAENRYTAQRSEPSVFWLCWCGMILAEQRRRAAV